jgi:hypothetical protein
MKNEIRSFLTEAYTKFGVQTDSDSGYYVRTDCTVSLNQRYFEIDSKDRTDVNPILFLTELQDEYSEFEEAFERAKSPYISFIIGQYGQGKTELVKQICTMLIKNNSSAPLPISLVQCRKRINNAFNGEISIEKLLFLSIDSKIAKTDIEEIVRLICVGKIILLLDGLDELIQGVENPGSFCKWFLEGLSALFLNQNSNIDSRVVVTMREEFLSIVSNKEATDITGFVLNPRNSHNLGLTQPYIYILNINFFDDSRISAYIRKRERLNPNGKILGKILLKDDLNSSFRDIFHRPLLLRLLADWAMLENARLRDLLKILKESSGPALFIKLYINTAAEDTILKSVQNQILACSWDPELIAKRCLFIYEGGREYFEIDDLREIVIPLNDPTDIKLTDQQAVDAVHKCPFLLMERGDEDMVFRFSHKIFYEYFVAFGMYKDYFPDNGTNHLELKPFDELVLNVDMRKLLRAFVGDKWHDETKLSYGINMTHWKEWNLDEVHGDSSPIDVQSEYEGLNQMRIQLLDLMSSPELFINEKKIEIENTIHVFLENQNVYHPRYLIFNYEAISVYLWNNNWDPKSKKISEKFSEILKRRAGEILEGLRYNNLTLRRPWLLLLERILSIGYKLRYTWVRELSNIEEVVEKYKISNPQILKRISIKLKEIKVSELW